MVSVVLRLVAGLVLVICVVVVATSVFADVLGLKEEFALYRWFGISRSTAALAGAGVFSLTLGWSSSSWQGEG